MDCPFGWFCGSTNGHHPIPQFLGGNKQQNLITLAHDPHVVFHNSLNNRLKELFGMRGGRCGGGTRDWEGMMQNNPGPQRQALDAVLDVARQTDLKYGTNITSPVWENIINGRFRLYP